MGDHYMKSIGSKLNIKHVVEFCAEAAMFCQDCTGYGMEIEERRVLRRKGPLLEAYLRLNSSTLKSLRDQGLIDRETSRAILVSTTGLQDNGIETILGGKNSIQGPLLLKLLFVGLKRMPQSIH